MMQEINHQQNEPAELLNRLVITSGLSLKAFAAKYGIPYRTIKRWKSGGAKNKEYLIELLSTCEEEGIAVKPIQVSENVLPEVMNRVRRLTGLSMPEFRKRYRIPERTFRNWTGGHSVPPLYEANIMISVIISDILRNHHA